MGKYIRLCQGDPLGRYFSRYHMGPPEIKEII